MAATLVLIHNVNWYLHDSEGHLHNGAGQKLDNQGDVIPDPEAAALEVPNAENVAVISEAGAAENAQASRSRMLVDYNPPDQYYTCMYAIRPLTFQRHDFELKLAYFTLMVQQPYLGLPHEHLMYHLERFGDLISAIKANRVPDYYNRYKLFKYSPVGYSS